MLKCNELLLRKIVGKVGKTFSKCLSTKSTDIATVLKSNRPGDEVQIKVGNKLCENKLIILII